MLGYCGVNCDECTIKKATGMPYEARAELATRFSSSVYTVAPEDIACAGCSGEAPLFPFCQECEIRACGQSRQIQHCGACIDYPCDLLNKPFRMDEGNKERLDRVKHTSPYRFSWHQGLSNELFDLLYHFDQACGKDRKAYQYRKEQEVVYLLIYKNDLQGYLMLTPHIFDQGYQLQASLVPGLLEEEVFDLIKKELTWYCHMHGMDSLFISVNRYHDKAHELLTALGAELIHTQHHYEINGFQGEVTNPTPYLFEMSEWDLEDLIPLGQNYYKTSREGERAYLKSILQDPSKEVLYYHDNHHEISARAVVFYQDQLVKILELICPPKEEETIDFLQYLLTRLSEDQERTIQLRIERAGLDERLLHKLWSNFMTKKERKYLLALHG